MARAQHDIVHSCLGRVDCLGLCAICETVMESINAGVEYSEDGGENRYKKLVHRDAQHEFFFGEWYQKTKKHRGIWFAGSGRRR